MNKSIILKADTFKYPTKEERKKIQQVIPKIDHLNVDYKSAFIEIVQNQPYDSAIRNEDLYWWANCLNNRFGKLNETYTYLKTHFLRLQETQNQDSGNHYTDKILLDYYIEIFYYYYFSSRDVLAQLINVVENLKIDENKIFLNDNFIKSISSMKIKNALSNFLNKTKDSYDIRNTFNHRFTPTHIDNRAKRNIIKENNKISFYSPTEIKTEKFVDDIDNLMKQLEHLMSELVTEIK